MKNILATTDFSDSASNAVDFAVALADKTNAAITLFHCYHVPVMVSDAPIITVPFEKIEKASKSTLLEKQIELAKKYPLVKINTVSKVGFAIEEIIEYSKKNNIDLVVMGISGSGKIDQLLGSTATAVSKISESPVLIIPKKAKFSALSTIVVAFDFKEIENTNSIDIVLQLSKHFSSTITGLNIKQSHSDKSLESSLAAKQANSLLAEVPHRMVNYIDTDTIHGIDHYLNSHDVDLLVMLKRKHGFFDQLFNGSNTNKMAFHTHVPLMVIHE